MSSAWIAEVAFAAATAATPEARAEAIRLLADAARSREGLMRACELMWSGTHAEDAERIRTALANARAVRLVEGGE